MPLPSVTTASTCTRLVVMRTTSSSSRCCDFCLGGDCGDGVGVRDGAGCCAFETAQSQTPMRRASKRCAFKLVCAVAKVGRRNSICVIAGSIGRAGRCILPSTDALPSGMTLLKKLRPCKEHKKTRSPCLNLLTLPAGFFSVLVTIVKSLINHQSCRLDGMRGSSPDSSSSEVCHDGY